MGSQDERRYARVETCNLISYTCIDDRGLPLRHGMGRALDVSQSGLLLETKPRMASKSILLTSIDEDDRLIEIEAEVVNELYQSDGSWRVGVQFLSSPKEKVEFAASLIKTC